MREMERRQQRTMVRVRESAPPPPPLPPLEGEVCVRYVADMAYNDGFDALHHHDEAGYRLSLEDIDEKFEFLGECSSDWSCHLIREDGNAKYEARTWMAKTRAEACFDGPPVAPKQGTEQRSVGVFTNLVPGAQYRLEIVRDRSGGVADPSAGKVVHVLRTLDIRNDGAPTGEDTASCSCVEGNPCASAYNCRDWANRLDIARRNGWRG